MIFPKNSAQVLHISPRLSENSEMCEWNVFYSLTSATEDKTLGELKKP